MTHSFRWFLFAAKTCRIWLTVLALLASANHAIAQTCALPGWDGPVTASGVINAYHGGSGSPAAGDTSISVASAAGLRTNARALKVGDLILIMQMQDSSGGNAGLHEYAQIVAITGTTLSLNRPLTNAYTQIMSTSSVRNWQVIWVPQYSAATITGTVIADRWTSNTTTGVVSGGIVAMDVTGSLAMNGTVSVAGSGFRGAMGLQGGATSTNTPTTTNSNFDPTSAATIFGGQKGEGTLGTPPRVFNGTVTPANYTTLLGQGYALGAAGQAAIGNGGGASNNGQNGDANNYNAGGGGGGNAGAGGQGGNSWNSDGLSAVLNSNQTVTQTGNIAGGFGGVVQTNLPTRIVMGGGGGSGAEKNTGPDRKTAWPPTGVSTGTSSVANGATGAITSSGASGGGIVLIRAGSLSSTAGAVIDATGYLAYNKNSGDTDSGGGGGGGGSVFIVAGSGTGTNLTIKVMGGGGGSSSYFNHGPGGGGGGGYVLSNLTAATVNLIGGSSGRDGCCGGTTGNGSPKRWNSVDGNPGSNSTTGGSAAGVQGGASCLPVIAVTKSTTTPNITTTTGATASYSINLSNSGGAASNVFMIDATLPPGWSYTASIAPTYAYNPVPPPAANSSAAGAETISASAPGVLPVNTVTTVNSATAVSLRAAATAPGVTPTTGNNTVTFGSFYLPQNSSITVSFVATIPNTATVGTYHNPAGVIFLDPTRTTTAVRMVSPASNVAANRNAIGYSANTTYASGGTSTVGGSNYSGLPLDLATDNVTLLPDLSVTKSMNTPTFTIGTGSLSYVIVGRNNGRPVADQVYANTQATNQSATTIMSTPLTITDTLPIGMTLTSVAATPTVWTCTANATSTTFTCSASTAVYPMAAATNLVTVTATVAISSLACPGPRINTATFTTSPIGDAVPSNNTGTVTTPINCATNLTVTKTDGRTTVTAGGTTSYTVTFSSLGPATGDGAVILDTPGAGLSCSVASCAATGTGVCPVPGLLPNLLSGGLTLSSFKSGATVSFVVSCNVTATGQ